MVVALMSLFVALSGAAYATVERDQVKSKHIKDKAVKGKDVGDNALTGAQIDEGSLGNVPSATNATTAVNATTATTATNANNASTLDTIDSAGFLQTKANRLRQVSDDTEDANYTAATDIVTLTNLAGGQYLLAGKVEVDNDGGAVETMDCSLILNGTTTIDIMEQVHGANAAAAQELGYSFVDQFTAAAGGTDDLSIRCDNPGGDNDADHADITALLVNN